MIAACVCECAQELCAVGIFLLTSLSLVIACVYIYARCGKNTNATLCGRRVHCAIAMEVSTYAFALQLLIYRCGMMRYCYYCVCMMRWRQSDGFCFLSRRVRTSYCLLFLYIRFWGGGEIASAEREYYLVIFAFESTDCFHCGIGIQHACSAVWFIMSFQYNTSPWDIEYTNYEIIKINSRSYGNIYINHTFSLLKRIQTIRQIKFKFFYEDLKTYRTKLIQ